MGPYLLTCSGNGNTNSMSMFEIDGREAQKQTRKGTDEKF